MVVAIAVIAVVRMIDEAVASTVGHLSLDTVPTKAEAALEKKLLEAPRAVRLVPHAQNLEEISRTPARMAMERTRNA